MIQKDKRIDEYISKSGDFAKPVLHHLRSLVHLACPNVEETIKWGFPHFDYKGMMCSMAAFKQHCAFGFWKTKLMKDAKEMMGQNDYAMGHLGKIKSMKDLPPDKKITSWIKEAMKLNDDDVKLPERKRRETKKEIAIPGALQKALNKNKAALMAFNNFSPSHKYEYIEWINEAKTEDTRSKRIATAIEWLMEGKSRNWKYMRKQG
jgi:uncharacterized protein YdeI (YjbR/CyaY-like superfamily)